MLISASMASFSIEAHLLTLITQHLSLDLFPVQQALHPCSTQPVAREFAGPHGPGHIFSASSPQSPSDVWGGHGFFGTLTDNSLSRRIRRRQATAGQTRPDSAAATQAVVNDISHQRPETPPPCEKRPSIERTRLSDIASWVPVRRV